MTRVWFTRASLFVRNRSRMLDLVSVILVGSFNDSPKIKFTFVLLFAGYYLHICNPTSLLPHINSYAKSEEKWPKIALSLNSHTDGQKMKSRS